MMNDNNQNKVPVDRQASTKYQSVIIHFYKTWSAFRLSASNVDTSEPNGTVS